MPMRSANCHILAVTCSVFLLGSLCSPREVPMKSEQNVQSQEHRRPPNGNSQPWVHFFSFFSSYGPTLRHTYGM
jgi:hypothetical protein